MLEIQHLTKKFYTFTALDDVCMQIPRGEIVGVLGPNGAGKTSLFKVITGMLFPDGGELRTAVGRWPTIGYKPERLFFPEQMRVEAYMGMMARLSGVPANQRTAVVREKMHLLGVDQFAHKKIQACSKGMRQRLGLAQALLGDPELLVLDEPSDGLDPGGQAEIQAVLRQLQAQGQTVLVSSHQLEEIASVCTEIVILNHGRVVYTNRMDKALAPRPQATIYVDKDIAPMQPLFRRLHRGIRLETESRTVTLHQEAIALRPDVLRLLLNAGYDVNKIERRRATLAEIYAQVTQ